MCKKNSVKELVIFEGVDGVGKSTIMKKWFGNFEDGFFHETNETSYNIEDTTQRMILFDYFDRSLIGELVWSDVFNRKPKISFKNVKDIIYKISNIRNIKIYLKMRPTEEINKNILERGEEKLNYDPKIVFIKYIETMTDLGLDFEVINTWK